MARSSVLFCVTSCILGFASYGKADEPKSAKEHYERGLIFERDRRIEDALACFSRAIEIDSRFVQAYFSRSSIYSGHPKTEKRDYKKSISDLTKILEIEPKVFSARFNRGLCYEYVREFDKAVADYTRIIDGETDYTKCESKELSLARAHHYRGRVFLWHQTNPAKAIADFDAALRLDPEMEMIHYRRGQAHHMSKDFRKARDDFAIAMDRDPDYSNALRCAAWLLATCPDPKYRHGRRAVELAGKALDKSGTKTPDLLDTLAAAYAEFGAFDDAITAQKNAIELLGPKAPPEKKQTLLARLQLYESGKPFRTE